MNSLSDQEILRMFSETSDKKWMEELFHRHAEMVYRVALKVMANESDAEDATQMVFIDIMREAKKGLEIENVKSWMIRMLINNCKDTIKQEKRRRKRQEVVSNSRELIAEKREKVDDEDAKARILDKVNQLPDRYRMPVWLRFFENFSFSEMAITLNVPEKTVRTQVDRGLAKLKSMLTATGLVLPIATLVQLMQSTDIKASTPISLDSSFLYQKSHSIAMAPATAASKGFLIPIILTSVLTVFSVGAWFFVNEQEKEIHLDKTDTGKATVVYQKNVIHFSEKNVLKGWDLLRGDFKIAKGEGQEGRDALVMAQYTAISIDISHMKLPIKISCYADYIFTRDTMGGHTMTWMENNGCYQLTNLQKIKSVDGVVGKRVTKLGFPWQVKHFYVEEKSIISQNERGLLGVRRFFDKPSGKIFLYTTDLLIVDQLIIEEVAEDQVLDIEMKTELFSFLDSSHFKKDVEKLKQLPIFGKIIQKEKVLPEIIVHQHFDFTKEFMQNLSKEPNKNKR